MMKAHTFRFRMMLLFSTVVGVLLAASYVAFGVLLVGEIRSQLNRQLVETARPIVADLITDANEQDVSKLEIPGEYFELLDASGRVLQRSKNLARPLNLTGLGPRLSRPIFGTATGGDGTPLLAAMVPFDRRTQALALAVAIPALGASRVVDSFARVALLLFPLSLLLTTGISAWYVGRSLAPITALTQHAAQMARQVTKREQFWTPLTVPSTHDELSRLAETFNQLLQGVDSALGQLRQFVTDASHELRTPLSVLYGETELLLSKPRTTEEYRQALSVCHDEVKSLTRIVEGLFTLSMADAGQLHLAREPLYLDEVLEQACALVTPRARAKDMVISRELQHEVTYFGDEAFLHQLFLIFLDNAIKYSPPSTRVQVGLRRFDGVVQARFEDQGIGIPSEHLSHIYERFYRAGPCSGGEAQSGGLGLAIAQAIVRAHGGSIECASTPQVGTTFTVSLPLSSPIDLAGGPLNMNKN